MTVRPPIIGAALAWLSLLRAPAMAMAALLTLLGGHLAGAGGDAAGLAFAALAVAFATGGGNALNDVHDWQVDRINRADRPIPSGAIGRETARRGAWTAFAAAGACAALASPWCLAVCVANCGLLALYARHSKRLGLGKGLLVGYLVGSAVLFGALRPAQLSELPIVLALCAALATLGREILKDIEDMAGDRATGARTLPLCIGAVPSRRLAALALVLAVGLSFLPWTALPGGPGWPGPAALAGLLGGAVILALAIFVADAGRAQRLVMLGSAVEMAAFALAGP